MDALQHTSHEKQRPRCSAAELNDLKTHSQRVFNDVDCWSMVLPAPGALVLDVRCLGALRVAVLVGRRTMHRGLLDVYRVRFVVYRRHRGDVVLELAEEGRTGGQSQVRWMKE